MHRWLASHVPYIVIALIIALPCALAPILRQSTPSFKSPVVAAAGLPTGTPSPAAARGDGAPLAATPVPPAPPGPAANKGDGGPPAAARGDGDGASFDLRHVPSIDPAGIARVLTEYHSPAVGSATAIYTLGLRYGIDPAFCLAFFIHESSAGTKGVAQVTKSVGNIRATAGYQAYQGYRLYATWDEGIEDWYRLIRDLYIRDWGLTTVDAIVPVYAPAADSNDPAAYAANVKQLVAAWRAGE
ncbi:MAG TPA: glucosaminidase domain-containing protein [Thermomicrobiales bacterium]|nr:glucosaminidase domain-containing protein [Thermomicrobiales bacterium]